MTSTKRMELFDTEGTEKCRITEKELGKTENYFERKPSFKITLSAMRTEGHIVKFKCHTKGKL